MRPYHFARSRTVGGLLPSAAIETSGLDEMYALDTVAGAAGFERMTLFGNADAQKQHRVRSSKINRQDDTN